MDKEEQSYTSPPVEAKDKGLRLDKYLAKSFSDFSRAQIQRLISEGNVCLDDTVMIDNSFKVREGDSYQITIPEAKEAAPQPQNIALDIRYEDDDLLVVNKPAGMTVHPAPGAYDKTLVNALLYHCKDNLSGIGGVKRPGIVHRIDKETSGLLVVAKTDMAHRGLSEQFAVHSIERTYYAFTYGQLQPLSGTIEGNIGRSPYDRKKMAIVPTGGKEAVTHYKTIACYKMWASEVQCNLETGRTHQIRVHLSSKGCNLIGDKVYTKNHKTSLAIPQGLKFYLNDFPRQALHAATLGFIHPRTGQYLSFTAELPEDMKNLKNELLRWTNTNY